MRGIPGDPRDQAEDKTPIESLGTEEAGWSVMTEGKQAVGAPRREWAHLPTRQTSRERRRWRRTWNVEQRDSGQHVM